MSSDELLSPPLDQYVGLTADVVWPRFPSRWEYKAKIISLDPETKCFEVEAQSGETEWVHALIENFAFHFSLRSPQVQSIES